MAAGLPSIRSGQVLTYTTGRCFGDKGDVEDITEGTRSYSVTHRRRAPLDRFY